MQDILQNRTGQGELFHFSASSFQFQGAVNVFPTCLLLNPWPRMGLDRTEYASSWRELVCRHWSAAGGGATGDRSADQGGAGGLAAPG